MQNPKELCDEEMYLAEIAEDREDYYDGLVLKAVAGERSHKKVPKRLRTQNRKSQADFHCIQCGHQDNADVNAAKNILARGHRVLACGAFVQQGSAVKQEPTETQTQRVLP